MYYAAVAHPPPGDSGTPHLQRRRLTDIPYDYTPYRQPDPYGTRSSSPSSFYNSNPTSTADMHARNKQYYGSPAVAGVGRGGVGEASHAPALSAGYFSAPTRVGRLSNYNFGPSESSQAPALSAGNFSAPARVGRLSNYNFGPGEPSKAPAILADQVSTAAAGNDAWKYLPSVLKRSAQAMDVSIQNIPMIMQPVYCDMWSVQCSTLHDLNAHKVGQKHKKNLSKLRAKAVAGEISVGIVEQTEVKRRRLVESEEPKRQLRFCEACSSFMYSQTDYEHHLSRLRHMTNVKKWMFEDKKMRMIKTGAHPSDVKICYTCNTVLNSQIAYDIHIAGQKHKSKLNKSTTFHDLGLVSSSFPSL